MNASKFNNNLMMIEINESVNFSKKKINQIIVIDNFSLNKETKFISYYYSELLIKYLQVVDIKHLYLITSYPKYKYQKINLNLICSEFNKIVNLYQTNINSSNDHYHKLFQLINKIINKILNEPIEIIFITKFNSNVTQNSMIELENIFLKNIVNFVIISTNDLINIESELSKKIQKFVNINFETDIYIKNLFSNQNFLIENIHLPSNCMIFEKILGNQMNTSFNVNLINNKYFLIKCDNVIDKISYKFYDVNCCNFLNMTEDVNYKNLIQAIRLSIDLIENDIDNYNLSILRQDYLLVQDLLDYLLQKNDKEIVWSSKLLNRHLKYIIMKRLNDFTIESKDLDINKLFNDLIKKSKIKIFNDKHQFKSNNRIIKNYYNIKKKSEIKNEQNFSFDLKDIKIKNSQEFFHSLISLSDWTEELTNNNALGILIKINSSDFGKIGIFHKIYLENITTTFVPILEYLETVFNYFNITANSDDKSYFDLNNQNILKGNVIGDGNAILPLFINKKHWQISKQYLDMILSIIIAHNPLCFSKNNIHIYFLVLVGMLVEILNKNQLQMNNKWINTFIAFFRTCTEISFENQFNKGIKKYLNEYINDPNRRVADLQYSYENIISQSISTGYILSNIQIIHLTKYFIEESIRINLKNYDMNYIKYLYSGQIDYQSETDDLFDHCENLIENDLRKFMTFIKFNKFFVLLYNKIGSFNKFLNIIDENYGLIPEELTLIIINLIKKEINFLPEKIKLIDIYNELNINFNKNEILFFIIQGILHRKNKYKKKAINNGTYLDIQKINNIEIKSILEINKINFLYNYNEK
ncbi:Hypothetical protein KVN_LOCUS539 [uncultured virus]|nr:Hypothetical protein KVN_LOCUS539 [uncultured virus]